MYNTSLSESEPEDQIRQFWRGGSAHVNEPHTEQCQGKFTEYQASLITCVIRIRLLS